MSICFCASGCACSPYSEGPFSQPGSCSCNCHNSTCNCRLHRSRREVQTARNDLNEIAGYLGVAADSDGRYGTGRS